MTNFDRTVYFDSVRASLFAGKMSQQQVSGQEAILGEWEVQPWNTPMTDWRWLAYMLATTYHETSQKMWPVEENGKGSGKEYGKKDPETGQTYYGRGYVQLTWRDNYAYATKQLGLKGDADLEWHAEMALEPQIAADIMFRGMFEGWFRSDSNGRQTLGRYFNDSIEDAYGAREIINGDKKTIPGWSNGVSIGNLIKGYYSKFLSALKTSAHEAPVSDRVVSEYKLRIEAPAGADIKVTVEEIT
jgi:putative chitinase